MTKKPDDIPGTGHARGRDCVRAKTTSTNNLEVNTMSSMSEQQQSRKFADKSATIANEAMEKGKANAERSAEAFSQSYSTAVENVRDYNLKIIDMT